MSFFEQSIFAIEEFISIRKKTGLFKQDKYFLALTASNVESNAVIQDFTQMGGQHQKADKEEEENALDDQFFGIAGATSTDH